MDDGSQKLDDGSQKLDDGKFFIELEIPRIRLGVCVSISHDLAYEDMPTIYLSHALICKRHCTDIGNGSFKPDHSIHKLAFQGERRGPGIVMFFTFVHSGTHALVYSNITRYKCRQEW